MRVAGLEHNASVGNNLDVFLQVFKCVLLNLQSNENPLLNDIDTDRLFNNIHDVYLVNALFWKNYFVSVLQEARSSRKGLQPSGLKEGFMKVRNVGSNAR